MSNYCLVENGTVVEGPKKLPSGWKSIHGLKHLSTTELIALGWIPYEEVNIAYDNSTHYRDGYTVDIQANKVVYTDIVVAYTTTELAEKAKYASKQYQRDRQPEYPPAADYLDGIVKGDQAQVDKYIADCLAVKQRHPK